MAERSSIPIPDAAVEDLAFRHARKELWHPRARGVKRRWAQLSEAVKDSWRRRARGDLEAAAPKLYAHWAAQLVEHIRSEGAKDADPNQGFDGPLLEAMLGENGGGWFEDCDPQRLTDGAANFVSSLLGLEDRT